MLFILILIFFICVNFVSASDNITDNSMDVILNTSDVDLIGDDTIYSATLNDINNAPLSNQTLIFSVNGINYTRTTNSEGAAFLNIRLNDGVYPISTIFKGADNRLLVNNNIIYLSHNEGTLIKDNLSGADIQKIIDDANSGDTLIFAGNAYNDVHVNINKPLNIISIVKSVFNGNSNSPVISINSDNVSISNFVISSGSHAILLNGTNNIVISDNDINNNNDGIHVLNSNNVLITNNNITESKNNGIYLKDSTNTDIIANTINNNYNGIYFDEDVVNTQIISNYISKSKNDAVSFAKSGSYTNMSKNILERNENGIFIDMVGDEELNIDFNTIQRNNDNGIYFGSNYRKSNESSTLAISNNSIIYNSGFNILGRDSIYMNINLKDNYVASDNPRFNGVCEKIKFNKLHLHVTQIDGNTLSVNVDGISTDTILKVSYNGGKNWQNVALVNGQATLSVSNDDGNVLFDYYEEKNTNYNYQLENYVAPSQNQVTPITPTPTDNPSDTPKDTVNETNPNQSETVEGNGTTSNPNSGSSQPQSNVDNSNNAVEDISQSTESSSSQTASQTVSTASSSQSVSKQVNNPTDSIAKALNIDEEVVRIAGMGFIVLLIILVIGLYYRDDVKYMLNKRNGH